MIPKKIILIIIFFLIVIYLSNLNAQKSCSIPYGPPPDNPDDNFSFNLEGSFNISNSYYTEEFPFIGILNNGNFQKMEQLLKRLGRDNIYAEKDLNLQEFKNVNVLIIPTGGLFGLEASSYIKFLLEQFAAQGGTILCFAQQNSEAYGVLPIPMGDSLNAYGWSQDSSCLRNSAYFKTIHSTLSSSNNELIDAGVDGYFSTYPTNSTILIKTKNKP
jgi:hypothetical protein